MRTADKRSGIYEITVTVEGQRHAYYVGSTVSFHRRRNHHWSAMRRGTHDNDRMQRAWNRYGPDAFSFAPLAVLERADLIDTERRLLALHHGRPDCMNMAADPLVSVLGYKQTPEHRAARSAALKGRKPSPETMAALKASRTGKPLSETTREKIRAANAGRAPVKALAAARLVHLGRVMPAEQREKIAAAHRGKATRATGWKHTPEARERIRAAWARRREALT